MYLRDRTLFNDIISTSHVLYSFQDSVNHKWYAAKSFLFVCFKVVPCYSSLETKKKSPKSLYAGLPLTKLGSKTYCTCADW